jgi:uncharacterized protein
MADIISNTSGNETFENVVASRREVLGGSIAFGASLGAVGSLLRAVPARAGRRHHSEPLLGFEGVQVSSADTVVVPAGYTAKVLIAWGDPISDGPPFKADASNSAKEQEWQWGMHNDRMLYFPLRGSQRGLLVQNNEYTDDALLFSDGTANWNQEKTNKSLNAYGVDIIEIAQRRGRHNKGWSPREWELVRPSAYARRISGMTPIEIGGPAAGDLRLVTSADPTGSRVLGTLNNCAMGFTPWGTYLACEENFNGFRKNGAQTEMERRYGINTAGFGYLWHTTDRRFRVDEEPNEPNRFGWVVEINAFDPNSTPVKRTALGRFKHKGAWVQEARDGRVVVCSGDDEQLEYMYRYVSRLPWRKALRRGINPLDDGTLYVAKFHSTGEGEWLPLTPENPALAGWTLADLLINTRAAADLAGATKMDRPEWIGTFPDALTVIATLTNNTRRGSGTSSSKDAPHPRPGTAYGHVIQWSYRKDWTELMFGWETFALCADPANADHGSTITDKYGSLEGLYVSPSGRLWIQTNSGAYAGFSNNLMLCADPVTRETRRFLTGSNMCEITGVFVTPDERTMFVGIQYPGEVPTSTNEPGNPKRYSSWPDGPEGDRPRSACIVITKDDGGPIGS